MKDIFRPGMYPAAALALALALPSPASSADLVTEPAEPTPPVVVAPLVTGSLTLYGWLPWIDGDVGVRGAGPVDVSLDPHDILENLNMTFMGSGDIRWGPVGLFGDLVYMDLGKTAATPGPLFGDATAGLSMTIGTVAGTYQLYEEGNDWLQVVGGARFYNIEAELDLSGGILPGRSADGSLDWVDPMVGLRGRKELDANWFLAGNALIGGFGVGSELSWDVFGGLGYKFNESISMTAGYRALGIDYSDNGTVIDLVTQGPLVALTFSF
jgi:opacity protein-like surface antigen